MNRRGVALILAYVVVAIMMLLGSVFVFRSISESRIMRREADSTRAFWVAEAGIAEAIANFPDSPLSGNLGDINSTYSTQTSPVAGFTDRYRIVSVGSANTGTRTIEVIAEEPQFGEISDAVTTTDDLTVGGSATVNGTTQPHADLDFAETFGMTLDQLKSQADHLYIDPPNNIEPVDGITCIEISPGNQLIISDSAWSGSGLLVVEGDMKISGGDFSGILWVAGTLDMITGNPDITGAVLVDCGENEVKILGNAVITHDQSAIDSALGNTSLVILSWSEI